LKAYDRFVIWLEYFNSELKRRQGRRVPLSAAIRSPTLKELEEACRRLALDPKPQAATFPGSPRRPSGYASVRKEGTKQKLLVKIARQLSAVRGEEQKTARKV
jgi:signal recognition particle subunit SRP19